MMSRRLYDAARADNRSYRLAGSIGAFAAAAPTKVTIHIPSKSLSIMPYYFGKDKGFFAAEQIEPQLVMMAPPTAIAALVARRIGFFFDHRRRNFGDHARIADSAGYFTCSKIRSMCYWRSRRSNRCRISSVKPSA